MLLRIIWYFNSYVRLVEVLNEIEHKESILNGELISDKLNAQSELRKDNADPEKFYRRYLLEINEKLAMLNEEKRAFERFSIQNNFSSSDN